MGLPSLVGKVDAMEQEERGGTQGTRVQCTVIQHGGGRGRMKGAGGLLNIRLWHLVASIW